MGNYIGFGNNSVYLLFPLFLSFSCLGNFMSYSQMISNLKQYQILLLFCESFSLILCGIPEIISNKISENASIERITIIKPPKQNFGIDHLGGFSAMVPDKPQKNQFYHILFIAFLHLLAEVLILFERQYSIGIYTDLIKILQVIFSGGMCFFIFDYKLYRHNIISIIMSVFSVSITTLCNILVYGFSFDYIYCILCILEILIYGSVEVYEKWVMTYKFTSPYTLLFFEGIFSLIMKLIASVILFFIPCKEGDLCPGNNFINVIGFIDTIKKNYYSILFIALYIVATAVLHLFRTLTNKTYTPTHRVVADTLVLIYLFIIERFSEGKFAYWYISAKITAYVVLLFSCLMYHEIIIIKVCKLSEYSSKEIIRRSENEYDAIQKSSLIPPNDYKEENENSEIDVE